MFKQGWGFHINASADSRYASRTNYSRSVSGGVVRVGNLTTSHFSGAQKTVSFLSSEAEYVAVGDTVEEAMFSSQRLDVHGT